jgi:predicted rRNA methylase YqxC with S4 and FtsJ domains
VGLGSKAVLRSPLTGAGGNVEFLLWARRGTTEVTDHDIEAVVT